MEIFGWRIFIACEHFESIVNLVLRTFISHVPEVCFRQMGVLGVQEDDHQRLLQQMASRLTMSDIFMGWGGGMPRPRVNLRGEHRQWENTTETFLYNNQCKSMSLVLANNTACFERTISRVKVQVWRAKNTYRPISWPIFDASSRLLAIPHYITLAD